MKKQQKLVFLATVALLLLATLLFTDIKWFFLTETDLIEGVLQEEPVVEKKVSDISTEICIYTGGSTYYPGMILAEYDGVPIQLYAVQTTVSADETGVVAEAESILHIFSPIIVKEGMICFLSPMPIRESFLADESEMSLSAKIGKEQFDCPLTSCEINKQVAGSNSVLWWQFSVGSNMDEVDDRIFQQDDGTMTVHLDQLYYYEYDLTWLQEMILGGA